MLVHPEGVTMLRSMLVALVLTATTAVSSAEHWPQWRGPQLNGVSSETGLPVRWTTTENVTWKLRMPDVSGATPIVWGDHIFLNVAEGGSLFVWAVDRSTGTVAWKRPLGGGDHKMRKQNMSSPSPVTDGKSVWVMTGTGILKAFSVAGEERWARDIQKDYGPFGLNWGYASSPLLVGDALYVQVLHGMKTDDPSYVMRIDGQTGKTVWRIERPTEAISESPDAYTTPTVLRAGGRTDIVVSGGDIVTGHHEATGKELWRVKGLNPGNHPYHRVVASPLVAGDLVFAPSRERPLLAIRAGGRGDITESHRAWSFDSGPDVPTPVTDGTYFYSVNDRGIVYCLDAKTGRTIYGKQRITPGTYSASPVLAGGHIYITSEEGVTSVFKAGPTFELVAENAVNEFVLSSIAVSDGQIFLRTGQHLYAIGQRRAPK
jgi:outer membrane protein assembly factor BamB